jgi:hypothetical protein
LGQLVPLHIGNAFDLWWNTVEADKRNREMDGFMNQMNAMKQKQLEKFALKLLNAMLTKAWNHWFNLFVQLRKVGQYSLNPGAS